jgi:hypothetical protein
MAQTHQTEKESPNKTTERSPSSGSFGTSGRDQSSGSQAGQNANRQPSPSGGSAGGSYGSPSGHSRESSTQSRKEHGADYESGRGFAETDEYGGPYGSGRMGESHGGFAGTMHRGTQAAGAYVQEWTHKAEEAIEPLEEYTRERPLTSLLIAAGLGALCGMLLFRR